MPRCKDCGELYEGRRYNHDCVLPEDTVEEVPETAEFTPPEAEVEEVAEEVNLYEPPPPPPPLVLVDYPLNGYTLQAPEGATLLYTESDPVNGVTRAVFQTAMAAGDGRPDDPAGQYVWRKP